MKHTVDQLLELAHGYYPRGTSLDKPDRASLEHGRLVEARRQAATDPRWRSLLERLYARFPKCVQNDSLHLPTGEMDAAYSCKVFLPPLLSASVGALISFLAPYYVLYSYTAVEDRREKRGKWADGMNVWTGNTCCFLPWGVLSAEVTAAHKKHDREPTRSMRQEIRFAFSDDETPYAEGLAREIEAVFGCEPMPPEIGTKVVPGVERNLFEDATIYDCLFSDHIGPWIPPTRRHVPVESWRRSAQDEDDKAPSAIVAKALAAFESIVGCLAHEAAWRAYSMVTVPVLRRHDVLEVLDRFLATRELIESPEFRGPRAWINHSMAAALELRALVAAWAASDENEDQGGDRPPAVIVDWSRGYGRGVVEGSGGIQ